MTLLKLKNTVTGLLIGDNKLPKENDVIIALLDMAFNYLVNKCQTLHLMTLDKSEDIQRIAKGEYLVRKPELPTKDTDELDIDEDLAFIAASLIASYVSDKKTQIHMMRADEAIRIYNAKVTELLESVELQ